QTRKGDLEAVAEEVHAMGTQHGRLTRPKLLNGTAKGCAQPSSSSNLCDSSDYSTEGTGRAAFAGLVARLIIVVGGILGDFHGGFDKELVIVSTVECEFICRFGIIRGGNFHGTRAVAVDYPTFRQVLDFQCHRKVAEVGASGCVGVGEGGIEKRSESLRHCKLDGFTGLYLRHDIGRFDIRGVWNLRLKWVFHMAENESDLVWVVVRRTERGGVVVLHDVVQAPGVPKS